MQPFQQQFHNTRLHSNGTGSMGPVQRTPHEPNYINNLSNTLSAKQFTNECKSLLLTTDSTPAYLSSNLQVFTKLY